MTPQAPADAVRAWIDDDINASAQQRAAVYHDGNMFLTACPGAGKTRTVGVRLAWWSVQLENIDDVSRTRRIAALSYTNIAVEEFAHAAVSAGCQITGEHFLGTIHKFMLRYVVRPLGATVMECEGQPRLVTHMGGRPETVSFKDGYVTRHVSLWDLHWRADGTLVLGSDSDVLHETNLTPEAIAAKVQKDAVAEKLDLAASGLMSMSDAMYWAMRTLEQQDNAQAVAARFDELIVDEAQDTGDTQLRSLTLLRQAGLRSLVLIGDPDQAIYGFTGADPAQLQTAVDQMSLDRLELTENWRSSRLICEMAGAFRAAGGCDEAVSERRELPFPPELIVYEAENPRGAFERFIERLKVHGLTSQRAAVICRTRATRDVLNATGGGIFKGRFADLAELTAATRDGGTPRRTVVADAEADLVAHAWPELDDDALDDELRRRVRSALFELCVELPELTMTAKDWCAQTRAIINAAVDELAAGAGHTPAVWKANAPRHTGPHQVNELLAGRRDTVVAQTIHAVKGESHDVTLVVAATAAHYDDPTEWLVQGAEPGRVAYVALTRAKQYVALAIPASCTKLTIERYVGAGFKAV